MVIALEPETEGPWTLVGWGSVKGEEARDTSSQVSTCSPFLPTASYQQGVLSATLLYEILLGKATLYAVLVSALVLMAMVRRGQDRAGRLEVTLEMQQHRHRNVETPPGPEVGREEEGVHPHASEDTLPLCDHSGRAVLGRRNWGHQKTSGWMLGGDLLFVLSGGHPASSRSPALLAPGNPHTFSSSGQEKRFLKPASSLLLP